MQEDQAAKAATFRALHERERAFVIPNPWDAGSARILAELGFEALATTSAGFAYSIGRADGAVSREEMLAHVRTIAAASDLPVSADLENGYAHAPEAAAETYRLVAEAGAVGASIEDFSCDADRRIYDFEHAVERVAAAVEAVRKLPMQFTLTARAEGILRGVKDLDDTIRRLQAFEAAGADVLYAPGLKSLEEVRTVCASLAKPVNVLATPDFTLDELSAAGARRISVGSALYRAVTAHLFEAAREMRRQGSFTWAARAVASGELAAIMRAG